MKLNIHTVIWSWTLLFHCVVVISVLLFLPEVTLLFSASLCVPNSLQRLQRVCCSAGQGLSFRLRTQELLGGGGVCRVHTQACWVLHDPPHLTPTMHLCCALRCSVFVPTPPSLHPFLHLRSALTSLLDQCPCRPTKDLDSGEPNPNWIQTESKLVAFQNFSQILSIHSHIQTLGGAITLFLSYLDEGKVSTKIKNIWKT